jgi:hypothetical protein
VLCVFTQNCELILPDGNARNQNWLVARQVVISGAQGDRNFQLCHHLHPFVDVDQLWHDTVRMKHIEKISGDADHIIVAGDTKKPFEPWFAKVKVSREQKFHVKEMD